MTSNSAPNAPTPSGKSSPPPALDTVLPRLESELTLRELWRIASRVGLSAEQFEIVTGESPHRLRRGRGGDELIAKDKNAPILRCAKVFSRVVALCNQDEAAARAWLNAPAPMLKNRKPIDVAQTVPGSKNVDALVSQLEKAAGLRA